MFVPSGVEVAGGRGSLAGYEGDLCICLVDWICIARALVGRKLDLHVMEDESQRFWAHNLSRRF